MSHSSPPFHPSFILARYIVISKSDEAALIWMQTVMQPAKYILSRDDKGWHGYLEGYREYEIQGESFEELQGKLWQLHQELASGERQRAPVSRPMSHAQVKRRARVEQLMFSLISNP